MNKTRVITKLDIKGPNLVKGVHLEGLRVLGDPRIFAEAYYRDGVDELIYMDVVASLYGRNSLLDFVNYTADIIFVPLTVGGGVRTLEDVNNLLRAGADKVAINTAAIKNPELIRLAAKMFGSQCVVVSVEAKRLSESKYECFTDNARERTGVDVFEWVKKAEGLGAGEIFLTSVDYEGTGNGFDLELVRRVAESVSIPVIACGGAGKHEHFSQAVIQGKADAVAAASVFHYDKLQSIIAASAAKRYEEGNVNYIKDFLDGAVSGRKNIAPLGVRAVKQHLREAGVSCRT